MHACGVAALTASQQGPLSNTCFSIRMEHVPLLTNPVADITWSESVGRARRHAVAPGPRTQAPVASLSEGSRVNPPGGSPGPGGPGEHAISCS